MLSITSTTLIHTLQSYTATERAKIRYCMLNKMSVLLSLLLVAVVAAQNNCPNAATECPDNCAGEQCARFLNAECQDGILAMGFAHPTSFGGATM